MYPESNHTLGGWFYKICESHLCIVFPVFDEQAIQFEIIVWLEGPLRKAFFFANLLSECEIVYIWLIFP